MKSTALASLAMLFIFAGCQRKTEQPEDIALRLKSSVPTFDEEVFPATGGCWTLVGGYSGVLATDVDRMLLKYHRTQDARTTGDSRKECSDSAVYLWKPTSK